jgi:hypothetical protein
VIIQKTVTVKGKEVSVESLKSSSCVKVLVQCPECGKTRTVHYRSIAAAGHHVCQSCMMKKQRVTIDVGTVFGSLTVLGPSDKSGYSVCRCECGNVTNIYNQNLYRGQISCGCIRMHNFDNVNRPKGEQHGMWKGGITSDRQRAASTKIYKDWKKRVLQEGEYRCLRCGSLDDLCVHHIQDYQTHPEKKVDPNNGAVLCRCCQNAFHNKYGRLHTTMQQFEEFINDLHNP